MAPKLVRCGEALSKLPPADGLILVDTNPGNAASALRRINGAVTNDVAILGQNARPQIYSALDPFSPKNGFNPNGPSKYTESFQKAYSVAQATRMNRLIDLAILPERLRNQGQGFHERRRLVLDQ